MPKLDVVLVVLNVARFKEALRSLNVNNANLAAIVADGGDGSTMTLGGREIPILSFAKIKILLDAGDNFVWLINGFDSNVGDIWKAKKFLMDGGVPEDNIVNFEILPHLSNAWLANLRYVEANGADIFATGISYAEVGLDWRYIPHAAGRAVNLACSNQDLRQGYLTAKHVFKHVAPGTIKFVLIGLTPYSFRYDNAEAFSVCSRNLQYMLALDASPVTLHDKLLDFLVSESVKAKFLAAAQIDLNLDSLKNVTHKVMPAQALLNWEGELNNLIKKPRPQVAEQNFQILREYIDLCRDNGAQPVGVILPFAPIIRKHYDEQLLSNFREALRQLDFPCIDLFDLELEYDCFYNTAHLNLQGAASASTVLGLRLYGEGIIRTEDFCDMNYSYFETLAELLSKENYNGLLEQVLELSAERLRRKDKIKIGFVLHDSAIWCGDDLYNYLAADKRFEPTIFLCLRTDSLNDELIVKDFRNGAKQFGSRGLNVTPLPERNSQVPAQDVLIYLTPYLEILPDAFRLENVSARTLLYYIPYGFNNTTFNICNEPVFHVCRRLFFDSQYHINLFEEECSTGMSRGVYSGYPKLDFFFKSRADSNFTWKTTRHDAKKIIWAPHWSIDNGIFYSTFQWNYRFMYDFARMHPEISWVVKPHPNLLFSAVTSGLFPSEDAFRDYLDAWDALPNAQVITGGYYQEIFATSDGLIHDSASFIAEYQFTHKPMIFLRRDTQAFNDLGAAILNVSYLVDGSDLRRIAELMQAIFIEGNDPMFEERLNFFDAHLNYFKHNGMTAGEFIYRNIAQELDS